MKAAVYTGLPAPGTMGARIQIQDVPDPTITDGEALVRIEACCVCGTDLRTYRYGDPSIQPGCILGHEFCATLVESSVPDIGVEIGQRLSMYIVLIDGTDRYTERGRENLSSHRNTISYHYDGAFAPLMKVPALAIRNQCLFPVTSEVPSEQIALAEPLGCCMNAHTRLNITNQDTVVVIGAGPIGLMHAAIARHRGAQKVLLVDTNPRRLEAARSFDIDGALLSRQDGSHKEELLALTDGFGPDVVIVAVASSAAQSDALDIAAKGGRVCFFAGLPKSAPEAKLNVNHIHYKELEVFGSYSEKKSDFQAAFNLLNSGKFPSDKLITHTLPLDQTLLAFPLMETGVATKVCITPS